MHFVEAKGILSSNNGRIYTEAVRMAAFIATAGVTAMDLHMNLRI